MMENFKQEFKIYCERIFNSWIIYNVWYVATLLCNVYEFRKKYRLFFILNLCG